MAQAPQSPGGNDNFIRRIVTDPKNVPDVMLLTGYLGASSEEAHERLYLSPDLTNYVEIPNTAILHQAPLPKEQDAHGGVTLWVRKDAALQYKMAPAAQALANYFAARFKPRHRVRPAAPGPSRTTRHHRGALRHLQLFASLRDRNHALHQHPREYLFLPRYACLPVRRTSSASRRAPAPMWAVVLRLRVPKDCFVAELPPPPRPDQASRLVRAAAPSASKPD